MIRQVALLAGDQVLLAAYVAASRLVESEGAARITDAAARRFMVGGGAVGSQGVGHVAGGGDVGNVIRKETGDTVRHGHASDPAALPDVANDESLEGICHVSASLLWSFARTRARHTALQGAVVKGGNRGKPNQCSGAHDEALKESTREGQRSYSSPLLLQAIGGGSCGAYLFYRAFCLQFRKNAFERSLAHARSGVHDLAFSRSPNKVVEKSPN